MTSYELAAFDSGYKVVAGVDEAGRGPLAGPVSAAAVIFSPSMLNSSTLKNLGINDSKKLTEKKRDSLVMEIYSYALSVGVGIVWPKVIDDINILRASQRAMDIAVTNLAIKPDRVLVDGPFTLKTLDIEQEAIKGGDGKSISIAAASIIAKTTRDMIMKSYDNIYPEYGFAKHKGYGTKVHREAIKNFGATPIHRRSFRWG